MRNESTVFFADIAVERLEPAKTLPPKFERMLKRLELPKKVEGKSVGVKMHYGGGTGYTTIHPVFVRILVEELKASGAKSVKVMDNNPENGIPRGYVREVLGCDVVSTFGATGKYVHRQSVDFEELDEAVFGGEALDCDFLVDISHVKGHGACGFGGALKNLAMGVVTPETRSKLHRLEGGVTYIPDKCVFCLKCFKECPNAAIKVDKEKKLISIFHHNCTYCQHCVMICPADALEMSDRKFKKFAMGMAKATERFLRNFDPENLLFINFLLNITVFCDCWGMSTASLVPDIGILASDDIVAVETASLDMIKTEDILPNALPPDKRLSETGHLFERIHGKDPYLMLRCLEDIYDATSNYRVEEVR